MAFEDNAALRGLRYVPTSLAFLALLSAAGASAQLQETVASDTVVVQASTPAMPGIATLVPEVRIGMLSGPPVYQFTSVGMVESRPDGSIVVFDGSVWPPSPPDVREFDADGSYVRTFGRIGDGPGEYQSVTGLSLLPDGRLVLLDRLAARMTVYSPEGETVDSWRVPVPVNQLPLRARLWGGLKADTEGLLYVYRAPPSGDASFVRLTVEGNLVDELPVPVVPGRSPQEFTYTTRAGRTSVGVLPYSPHGAWDLSPDGFFVTAWTGRYAIDLRRPTAGEAWTPGDPVTSIRRSVPPVPVDDVERDQRRDRFIEGFIGDRDHGPIPEIPPFKTPIRNLVVASDGRIWVHVSVPSERYDPEDPDDLPWREPDVFDVFEDDGTYVGRVGIPHSVEVLHRRGDHVWGVTEDEFDVPYVTRYRINWG